MHKPLALLTGTDDPSLEQTSYSFINQRRESWKPFSEKPPDHELLEVPHVAFHEQPVRQEQLPGKDTGKSFKSSRLLTILDA